ncbi:MAG: hypothetical protein HY052_07000 [Proteobacteria bacterium]|nr:hypothetical protein [Pseudomonadota bacterium]
MDRLFSMYLIEPDFSGTWEDTVRKRDDLGRAIAALAKAINTPVWFHELKDPAAGAPVILLECPKAFMDAVEQLPGFNRAQELSENRTTRSAQLQNYFATKPIKPTAPKPPRFGN